MEADGGLRVFGPVSGTAAPLPLLPCVGLGILRAIDREVRQTEGWRERTADKHTHTHTLTTHTHDWRERTTDKHTHAYNTHPHTHT